MVGTIVIDGLFAAIAAIGFGAISNPPRRAFLSIAIAAAIGHALLADALCRGRYYYRVVLCIICHRMGEPFSRLSYLLSHDGGIYTGFVTYDSGYVCLQDGLCVASFFA